MSTLDAKTIASYCISDPGCSDIQVGQIEHRINLISKWNIKEGDRVLELGCGQGDCTAALAAAVGDNGSITAVDPAPPGYGAPWNIAQAHAYMKASPIGHRITFHQADPRDFLTSTDTYYDVAVLAHCIWYFSSPSVVLDTLKALSSRTKRVCLAEYALAVTDPTSVPHVMAALAHASLECRKPQSTANVRTVLSPLRIKDLIKSIGLVVVDEGILKAPAKMFDGKWEVAEVLGETFRKELEVVKNERERAVVEALIDATRSGKENLTQADLKVTTMDIWYGVVMNPRPAP